jgi:hypothetical protein
MLLNLEIDKMATDLKSNFQFAYNSILVIKEYMPQVIQML